MTFDPEKFALRVERQAGAEDVVLVCHTCREAIYGAMDDGLGKGEPEDNTLGRLMFVAEDHANLFCKGARA